MSHKIQFQKETLNTISNGNSSHFMKTISLYLVKISVNVVTYCTIITWYKIDIDSCFCDGQSSKGNNSKSINDRVIICDALTFLLDNIFIRFGTKLYRQVVGIPMGTNCAPLVADLFLFCYERDFMMSLSDDKQADVINAFNTTSRYLDDILNINNVYFDNMVSQIYPSELQLNKANASDTEAAFLDLHLSISNDIVSTKIYDKRDDFDFEIVNFPF